ncbi:hypothetical protein V9L20_05950 [Variovorax sp. CCNWLW225]|jgi:hypothetical protein|uniref:hypothetical protein n=2 Tax=Variovorax TaxID=34072 RepID=UPI003077B38C
MTNSKKCEFFPSYPLQDCRPTGRAGHRDTFEFSLKERCGKCQRRRKKRIQRGSAMPLFYLLSLQTALLPKVVTRPEDVQYVSVLKATGLVEADIAPASDAWGKYHIARTATVTRITEDGLAEINKMLHEPRRMARTLQIARNKMRRSSLA